MSATIFPVVLLMAALVLAVVGFLRKDRRIWFPSIVVAGVIAAVGIVIVVVASLEMR